MIDLSITTILPTNKVAVTDWISALGPFFAVMLSILSYFAKEWYEQWRDKKQSLKDSYRDIEINVTRSMEDIYRTREELKFFKKRLIEVRDESRAMTGKRTFALGYTNFPATSTIYRNENLPNLKVSSFYLHNKLLWLDRHLEQFEQMIKSAKEEFKDLMRRNEMMAMVIKEDNSDAEQQRIQYADNLDRFAEMIENSFIHSCNKIIPLAMQIKIFNKYVREMGESFIKKHEISKDLNIKDEMFSEIPTIIEKIDQSIKDEVDRELRTVEDSFKKYQESK